MNIVKRLSGRRVVVLLGSLAALLFAMVPAYGQTELAKLLASDGTGGDEFGSSVAVRGSVAVVGAPHGQGTISNTGAAYVYRYDGAEWVEEQKLIPSDGQPGDEFGFSVSAQGGVVVIGARNADGRTVTSGAAYAYRYNGVEWVEEQKLAASDGEIGDRFGNSVALGRDVVLIGAVESGPVGFFHPGAAYMYRYNGTQWVEEQKLESDRGGGAEFGWSVALDGDFAVIGEPNFTFIGSAHVYRHDSSQWVEDQGLSSPDAASVEFGRSVTVDGNVIMVRDAGTHAAYVYRHDGTEWVVEQTLPAPYGRSIQSGGTLALSDDVAVVGAWGDDDRGVDAGAAYLYRYDGTEWVQENKVTASDGEPGDEFGLSVGTSANVTVIGAPGDDDRGEDAGAVYVFRDYPYFATPECGTTIAVSPGSTRTFTVTALGHPGVTVFLDGVGLPPDAVMHPPLPAAGNPTSSEFSWTPDEGDAGTTWTMRFTAEEFSVPLRRATCEVDIEVGPTTGLKFTSPQCGNTIPAVPGDVVAFPVSAEDDEGRTVTLDTTGLHPNAVMDPPLPTSGNPVSSDFTWATNAEDANTTTTVTFTATGEGPGPGPATETCGVTIEVGEPVPAGKLVAPDGWQGDRFGEAVAISGATVIVAAPGVARAGWEYGAAYIFRWNGTDWIEEARLESSEASDSFAVSVAIHGDLAVVGAPDEWGGDGKVYVYRRNGSSWSEEAVLLAIDDDQTWPRIDYPEYFGTAVAVYGDTVLVGTPNAVSGGPLGDTGEAEWFSWDGSAWVQTPPSSAPDYGRGSFGSSVALAEEFGVIGEPYRDLAHVHGRTGFSPASLPNGRDVAASGQIIAAGGSGFAYVHRWDGTAWITEASLTPGDGDDQFGAAVSVDGDTSLIGASESAYLYRWIASTWTDAGSVVAPDGVTGDRFGADVAIDGDLAVVGAPGDDNNNGENAGAVYVFRVNPRFTSPECGTTINADPGDTVTFPVTASDEPGRTVTLDATVLPPDAIMEPALPVGGNPVSSQFTWTLDEDDANTTTAVVFTAANDASDPMSSTCEIEIAVGAALQFLSPECGTTVHAEAGATVEFAVIASDDAERIVTLDGAGLPDGAITDPPLPTSGPPPVSGDFTWTTAAVNAGNSTTVVFTATNDELEPDTATCEVEIEVGLPGVWKVAASDGSEGDRFGSSVALSDDVAVIGARVGDSMVVQDTGAAYVLRRGGAGWVEEDKLVPSDIDTGDRFGWAVAVDGDRIAVGAPLHRSGLFEYAFGAAYVFERTDSDWVQDAKYGNFRFGYGYLDDWRFGQAVAIHGDDVLVGEPQYAENPLFTSDGSAAHVFGPRSDHLETPHWLFSTDHFGDSVALGTDLAVVGDPEHNHALDPEFTSGAAYVFRWSGSSWVDEAELLSDEPNLGKSVAIGDQVILAGATGAAFVYREDGGTWLEEAKLTPTEGGSDSFGSSVALHGDLALVGSPGEGSGTAYLFRWDGATWQPAGVYRAHDGAEGDRFGSSVALSAEFALIGAPAQDNLQGENAGSAYVFSIYPGFTSPECGTTIRIEPENVVSFTVAAMDEPERVLTLRASGLPVGSILDPPLPVSGNPVETAFEWYADQDDANTVHTLMFTATNDDPVEPEFAVCPITIEVGDDLLVTLSRFTTTPDDGRVTLDWTTEAEIDNAGFYLLRHNLHSGETIRLNRGLIPAMGDVFMGAEYTYVDDTPINGVEYEYVLVDVELSGRQTRNRGVRAVPNPVNPSIKLLSPPYGATVSLTDSPAFDWTPKTARRQIVTLSTDPTFADTSAAVSITVRGTRIGAGDRSVWNVTRRSAVFDLAGRADGKPLYWRVEESGLGWEVETSDTFSLWIDPDAGDVTRRPPSPAGSRIHNARRTAFPERHSR